MIAAKDRAKMREKKTGTRDAVEAAIDMAKEDRSTGWEDQIAKKPRRITPWTSPPQTCEK